MKRTLAFFLALLCMIPYAGAAGTDYAAMVTEDNRVGRGYVIGSDDWVTLHEAPDGKSAEIALMWPGEAVEIYGYPDSTDFVLCEYNEMIGFVMSENVDQAETVTYVEEEIVETGSEIVSARAVGDDWVILYEEASETSYEVAMIWPGETVNIIERQDGAEFVLCEYSGMNGYIRAESLEPADNGAIVTKSSESEGPNGGTPLPENNGSAVKEDNPGQYVYDDNQIGQLIVVDGYGDIPLYEHPSVDSAILALMSSYERVYAYNYPPNPDFYVIEYIGADIVGFAQTEYIDWKYGSDRNNPGYNVEERPGKWIHDGNYIGFMTVASGGAVVYEHPDTRSPQKATLAAGETVEVYNYSNYGGDFYLCELTNGPGFILRECMKPAGSSSSNNSSSNSNSSNSSSSGSSSSGMREDRPAKYMNNQNALGEWYVTNCNEWVSLREHPDTNSTRLEKVYLNDYVQAYEYSPNPDFYLCETSSGNIGFILKKYLECVMDVPDGYYDDSGDNGAYVSEYDYVGPMRVANCNEWVSLREYPDTGSARLAKVYLGDYVEAYMASSPDFYLCEYGGQTGFILKKYLEYGTDAPSGSSSGGSSVRITENDPWQYITEENFIAEMTVVNCDEWVSLREHPSTKSERITKLELGEVVDAYYYPPNPDFYLCLYMRVPGFVLTDYLE